MVDIASVADANHEDGDWFRLEPVDDAVVADAKAVQTSAFAAHRHGVRRGGIISQRSDSSSQAFLNWGTKRHELNCALAEQIQRARFPDESSVSRA